MARGPIIDRKKVEYLREVRGFTNREIAEELGCSQRSVSRVMPEHLRKPHYPKISPDKIREIKRLNVQGYPNKEIARRVGVGSRTVSRYAQSPYRQGDSSWSRVRAA